MPAAPNRPCRAPGCPALVSGRLKKGYCEAHSELRSNWAKRDDKAGSTTQRGYGHDWRKLRARILRRDRHLCQQCLREGRVTEATDVDHIVSKAAGGTDAEANLQSLCRDHHLAKTAREGRGRVKSPGLLPK